MRIVTESGKVEYRQNNISPAPRKIHRHFAYGQVNVSATYKKFVSLKLALNANH